MRQRSFVPKQFNWVPALVLSANGNRCRVVTVNAAASAARQATVQADQRSMYATNTAGQEAAHAPS